jgi:formylglycine-generating enzyme required for sulfatase activity
MSNDVLQRRALERQRRRLAELERRIAHDGPACAPGVLEERDELKLIVTMLEASLPEPIIVEAPQPSQAFDQRIIWPADGKEMVLVPAGPFVLGAKQSYRGDDQPAHEVVLPAFYIDRTLVTIGEYARFVAATGHAKPKIIFPGRWPSDYELHPVTGVSWHDACAYAAWAGKRLPSEAEWEKAASWDWTTATKRRYPWGDEWDKRRCNMLDTGVDQTSAVGSFSPYGDAPCGAADMAGNVFEWTSSLDWNYPYQVGDGRDDTSRYGMRVRRGGAYTSEEVFLRTTTRYLTPPDGLFFSDGFRCVADVLWSGPGE